MKSAKKDQPRTALLGLGLDGTDGHTRITRGDSVFLVGGSQETHARMQETVIKVTERLEKRGKRLEETGLRELRDVFHDVMK
ncbi:MAG: hypothetical protein K1X74_10275 [Pirellulales bacterium]|nr:hypothetical protein [Pirellulales bacterium]